MTFSPTPTPILKARGTFREDRHGKRADTAFEVGRPTCPGFLKGEAKREWDRQTKALLAAGVLTLVDRAVLAAWCATWQKYVEQQDNTVECRKLVDSLVKLARELGFSPVARARVTTARQEPEADALDVFLGEASG